MEKVWFTIAERDPPRDGSRLEFWCDAWDCPIFVKWCFVTVNGDDLSYWECQETLLDDLGLDVYDEATHWKFAEALPGPVVD